MTPTDSPTPIPTEEHPLQPFLPPHARLLMLGSFPPQKKRWCMDFYYPNFINDMWRIMGYIFHGDRNWFVDERAKCFKKEMIVEFLLDKGIVGKEAILKGFANVCETTGLRGRWEKLNDKPLVICDTGHNVAGWKFLSQQIEKQPCTHRHIVFGMVDDKDVEHVLQLLRDKLKNGVKFYWTQPSTKRAIPVEKLRDTALKYNLHGEM